MATSPENTSMAVFCDFENVALGVRDAKYEKFDIKLVLERLLLKGSIVVKKAYCDWDRYKGFKATMHEANFELIEIPHLRQSGKNSADIRLVVDALDLCYTKSHVNTFVIISGDSDFSPLVSKLRENAKQVIGVGVKQSTSDLLIANCDEFIFYDDLVREVRRANVKSENKGTNDTQPSTPRRTPEEEKLRKDDLDKRRGQAIDIALETLEALIAERGDSGKIWASVLKQAIKRRKPDFSESYYGFRTFGNLIEEAQSRGLLEFGRDEKSGAYVYRASGERAASSTTSDETGLGTPAAEAPSMAVESPAAAARAKSTRPAPSTQETAAEALPARKTRGARKPTRPTVQEDRPKTTPQAIPPVEAQTTESAGRSNSDTPEPQPLTAEAAPVVPVVPVVPVTEQATAHAEDPPKKKPSSRPRRPRKTVKSEE